MLQVAAVLFPRLAWSGQLDIISSVKSRSSKACSCKCGSILQILCPMLFIFNFTQSSTTRNSKRGKKYPCFTLDFTSNEATDSTVVYHSAIYIPGTKLLLCLIFSFMDIGYYSYLGQNAKSTKIWVTDFLLIVLLWFDGRGRDLYKIFQILIQLVLDVAVFCRYVCPVWLTTFGWRYYTVVLYAPPRQL